MTDLQRRSFLKASLKTSIITGASLASFSVWGNSLFNTFNAISTTASNILNTAKPLFNLNQSPTITLRGANFALGHQLLQRNFQPPTQRLETDVIIIGTGVAGLAAARYLYKNGVRSFIMVELEPSIGGNSSWSENHISRFPWGGHYLPIPGIEKSFLFEFLSEINVITGFNPEGLPFFNELYLCHDLKERLYLNGKWQEGLVPKHGVPNEDRVQIDRFFSLMQQYKYQKGNDGRYAFNIPLDKSSRDPALLLLDTINMKEFLHQQQLDSAYLHWYVDYCCRDDYGVGIEFISAWAGIHYFAARRAKSANADSDAVLTWPEGNGFLVENMAKPFMQNIKTGMLAYEVGMNNYDQHNNNNHNDHNTYKNFYVNCFNGQQNESLKIIARSVIMACPRFVAKHLIHENIKAKMTKKAAAQMADTNNLSYSPWLVANISVQGVPDARGADLAWDNVSFYSRSLGYINAKHQSLDAMRGATVLTYYLPLDDDDPKVARKKALEKNIEEWKKFIIEDLEKMHAGISQYIQHIDLWIWGHGMIRPTPGFIWGKERESLRRSIDKIDGIGGLFFAHSDMSGISIFEEAYWQGITTGKAVLDFLD